jgi:hypothetical protein
MRRARRPNDGVFTPRDALTWRRLIASARRAARNPATYGVDVGAKAGRAAKAVCPPGHAHRESVFVKLLLKARLFWGSGPTRQAEMGPELEQLAADCAQALAAGEGANGVRLRRDIHDIDGEG